jgi:hypothetical protein
MNARATQSFTRRLLARLFHKPEPKPEPEPAWSFEAPPFLLFGDELVLDHHTDLEELGALRGDVVLSCDGIPTTNPLTVPEHPTHVIVRRNAEVIGFPSSYYDVNPSELFDQAIAQLHKDPDRFARANARGPNDAPLCSRFPEPSAEIITTPHNPSTEQPSSCN